MTAVLLEKSDTAATLSTWIYCAMWQLGYVNWPNNIDHTAGEVSPPPFKG